MVLSFAVIFFVFNTFGETKINITLNSNSDLNDGLVGHWTFDGPDLLQNVADTSGNGNTGYLAGFTSTTTVMGKVGQALEFDGVDDYMITKSLMSSASTETLSFWVYAKDSGVIVSELGQQKINSGYHYIKVGLNQNNELKGNIWNCNNGLVFGTINLNIWYHVTLIYDGNAEFAYLDGSLKNSVSCSRSPTGTQYLAFAATDTQTAGGFNDSGYFTGSIDDVRLYNRALSADEVSRLYDLGATTYINKTLTTNPSLNDGLVGYWTFDGPLSTQITDSSGTGNAGYFGASSNATNTLLAIGNIGQAVNFDGIGDNMYIGNGVLSQTEPNGFSAFMWLKSSEANNGKYFFERGGSGSFYMNSWASKASCRIRNSASTYFTTPSVSILDGEWHHVGCSFSTTTKAFTMYVDGASTTSKNASTFDKFPDNATWFTIGGRKGGNFAQGTYDDFRVYNRSLSQDEVKRLYQQGATTYINKTLTTNPSLNDGLVGHWTFDGPDLLQNVADTSGNGNTGYLTGFTSTTTVIGKIGQALSFDGVDDYVDLSSLAVSTFISDFSVSVWFKAENFNNSYAEIVGTGSTPSSNEVWVLRVHNSNGDQIGDLLFRGNAANGGDISTDSGFNVTSGIWYNAIFLYDVTTGSSTVYLNGVKGNDNTVSTGGFTGGSFSLSPKFSSRYFNGSMDDVRVYNRILGVDEIKKLYELGN